jgi:adenine deaminase
MDFGLHIGVPSCVPASHLGDGGGEITTEDIADLVRHPRVYGLAEMMNWPAIVHGFGDYRERVRIALEERKLVDGHFPEGVGEDLHTYVSNGEGDASVRIMSDHECRTPEEALDKRRRGMHVMLRYGTAAKNLPDILPGILDGGHDLQGFSLCSDDLDAVDLREEGHVDRIIKVAREIIVERTGADLREATIIAIAMATVHPARYFGPYFGRHALPGIGEIAPGKRADLVVFRSLDDLQVERVICGGKTVVEGGEYVGEDLRHDFSDLHDSVHLGRTLTAKDFRVVPDGPSPRPEVRVIGAVEGQLRTDHLRIPMEVVDGELRADPDGDIAKIAVFERHRGTGSHAIGFVKNLGLRRGALASTVGHDCHNLLVVGVDDAEMAAAATRLQEIGGGLAVVTAQGTSDLPLEIGGLMSGKDVASVVQAYRQLLSAARGTGTRLRNPFMTLSFLALEVIQALKISNKGIIDAEAFEVVPLC